LRALCVGAGADVVAVVVVDAAGAGVRVVEVDDAAPHALSNSVIRAAAIGMRRCLMSVSQPPVWWLMKKDAGPSGLLPETSVRI
jgi:uncharacterized protein GlcG (DUF336 family)